MRNHLIEKKAHSHSPQTSRQAIFTVQQVSYQATTKAHLVN